jgi:hypothetical protein
LYKERTEGIYLKLRTVASFKKRNGRLKKTFKLATWEAEAGRTLIPGQPGLKGRPSLQNNQSKKGWRCSS